MKIVWAYDHHSWQIPEEMFLDKAVGLPFHFKGVTHTEPPLKNLLPEGWYVHCRINSLSSSRVMEDEEEGSDEPIHEAVLCEHDGMFLFVRKDPNDGELVVICAGDTRERVQGVVTQILDDAPPRVVEVDDSRITVNFWAEHPTQGPGVRPRRIEVGRWSEIVGNYAKKTAEQVSEITALRPPLDGGRLLLWHGPPGVGKSYAIRALIRAWAPWCDSHYIVDPDRFFNSAPYMMSVIIGGNQYPTEFHGEGDFILSGGKRWRLLIVEDSDEFMRSDAKQQTGQGLSRLLNLSDGLIGQGLNVLVLITTNAELKKLHPAIQREGRCMANVHFDAFTKTEAYAWLGDEAEALGDIRLTNEVTLAKLYDIRRNVRQITRPRPEPDTGQYV